MTGIILVVDDSAMMRKIVLRTLKTAGVEFDTVLEAGDGLEALALLRANTVQLIMCDINMLSADQSRGARRKRRCTRSSKNASKRG